MKVVVEFNRLPSSAKSARAAIGQALSDGAVKVQADAQQLAPVDTGRLRSGIHTEKRQGIINDARKALSSLS
jgi:hypothetical protein